MAMLLTDPSLRRTVMILCFAAAGLLTASEWRSLTSQPKVVIPLQPSRLDRLKTVLERSPIQGIARQVHIVIRLEARKLDLLEGDTVVQTYDIAVGQADWETPVGEFRVVELRKNPLWKHPITGEAIPTGPENPLGSRWIGFAHKDGYHIGIHGTNQEELVGQAVSHGCVRMRDTEIQALFEQVAMGTPITVMP